MELDVRYDDWHVSEGDRAIEVGRSWRVTLLLERLDAESDDWLTELEPAGGREPILAPLESELAAYSFLADVVAFAPARGFAPWVVLESRGIRFATAPRPVDRLDPAVRVAGTGSLEHDTYLIDDESVIDRVTHDWVVTRILYFPHRNEPVLIGGQHAFRTVGYGPPESVGSTHDISQLRPGGGSFLITVDTSAR